MLIIAFPSQNIIDHLDETLVPRLYTNINQIITIHDSGTTTRNLLFYQVSSHQECLWKDLYNLRKDCIYHQLDRKY
jgi:hypothetical protein